MSEIKKRKVHDSNDKLMYMHLLEEGASINYVHEHYGIGCLELVVLWKKYQSGDIGCLAKNDFARASAQLKRQIVRDIEKKSLNFVRSFVKIQLWQGIHVITNPTTDSFANMLYIIETFDDAFIINTEEKGTTQDIGEGTYTLQPTFRLILFKHHLEVVCCTFCNQSL